MGEERLGKIVCGVAERTRPWKEVLGVSVDLAAEVLGVGGNAKKTK